MGIWSPTSANLSLCTWFHHDIWLILFLTNLGHVKMNVRGWTAKHTHTHTRPLLSPWNVVFCSAFNHPLCFLQYNRQILTLPACFCLAWERSEPLLLIPLSSSLDDGQHTAANKALFWVRVEFCINVHSVVVERWGYRRRGVRGKTLQAWKRRVLSSSTVWRGGFRAGIRD